MAPTWLNAIAWFYIGVCLICAAVILYDIVVNRRRQSMGVMNWVFPITALYFGPFALAFYWRWARTEPRPVTEPSLRRRGHHRRERSGSADGDGRDRLRPRTRRPRPLSGGRH